jgi:hypothetical protein
MGYIAQIIAFLQTPNRVDKFLSILSALFDLLMGTLQGSQKKIDNLVGVAKKYRESGDVTVLTDLINK